MTARITTLVDKLDTHEIVRNQIAALLVEETEKQQELATLASKDANLWALRVFLERTNPWAEFQFADEPSVEQLPQPPIVNVTFVNSSSDKSKSDSVERQYWTATYNIDCFGYGVATETDDGFTAGDEMAAFEAHRAAKLVRNYLMAAANAWLGTPHGKGSGQFIWDRWVASFEMSPVSIDDRAVERVHGARIVLSVSFNEFSPQVEWQPLEIVSVRLKRKETGEVYLTAQYGEEEP